MTSKSSARDRLGGFTLEALKALGFRFHSGPDSRGTYRFGENQALRVYPSGAIVDYSTSGQRSFYRNVSELVRERLGAEAGSWIDAFLDTRPEPDPFDGDKEKPQGAEAAYAAEVGEMWRRAQPIDGTDAEAYLARRGIALPTWPDNLRYVESAEEIGHRAYGAFLAATVTSAGDVAAVQVLLLAGAAKAPLAAPRRTYVIDRLAMPNAYCGFGPISANPPAIVTAEGVEDALSLYQATGLPAVASLGAGNLGRVPACGRIILFFDQDGPQTRHVVEAAVQRAYASANLMSEPVIDIVIPSPRGGDAPKNDANLILQADGVEALRALVGVAEPATIPVSALAERYARLSPVQQANRRSDLKGRVKNAGATMEIFDRLVTMYAAKNLAGDPASVDGLSGLIAIIKPIDGYVSTAELFDLIRQKLKQHVIADEWQLDLMAVWVIGTYVHNALSVYPFLLFVAPTKGAGKTTAMIAVVKMSYRGYLNLSATEALLARLIDGLHPTLGLDEIDNLLRKPEVLGIINGSHNKTTANRGNLEPTPDGSYIYVARSTWCPKVMAGINEDGNVLPEATLSRCVTIRMRPQKLGDRTTPVDSFVEESLTEMQAYGSAWARDMSSVIRDIVSDKEVAQKITDGFSGRDADNFRAILTIAWVAGKPLYDRVRKAASSYLQERKRSEVPERNRQLLADVVKIFRLAGVQSVIGTIPEGIQPAVICNQLTGGNIHFDADYARWTQRNEPITPSLLGRALRPFDIRSVSNHQPGTKSETNRVVLWRQVKAAAEHYCPEVLTDPLDEPSEDTPSAPGPRGSGPGAAGPVGADDERGTGATSPEPSEQTPGPVEGKTAPDAEPTVRRGWKRAQP